MLYMHVEMDNHLFRCNLPDYIIDNRTSSDGYNEISNGHTERKSILLHVGLRNQPDRAHDGKLKRQSDFERCR